MKEKKRWDKPKMTVLETEPLKEAVKTKKAVERRNS
jgi:hypothetical protein